jgi:uncharacterized membrane protein HdeD (DUF308 family)
MHDTRRRVSVLVTRGLMVLALAVLAWLMPFGTIGALAIMFGGFTLIDGGFALVLVFSAKDPQRWATTLWLEGVASILAGGVVLLAPSLGIGALTAIVATWAIVTGALEVYAAYRGGGRSSGRTLLGAAGAVSILIGLLFLVRPGDKLFLIYVAIYAFLFGLSMTLLGLRLRAWLGHYRTA